ncbi:MAG: amidase [Actinomycetota bacterium]
MTSSASPRHYWSAARAADAVASGEVTSTELVEAAFDRIDRYDDTLNAVCLRFDETARGSATRADQAVDAGDDLGPLHGVPITVKEAYDLVGTPSTWGRADRADHRPEHNSPVIDRLEAAGAIIVGKTNVPEHLADWQSNNPVYGRVCNPWDPDRTPGGSSGGSAVALAAGYSFLEAGSDIGGSLRNPAHYCGVASLKPTFGIVPTAGHALDDNLADVDIAVTGPMARSMGDVELGMQVIAGFDGPTAVGSALTLPPPRTPSLHGARIAVCTEESVCSVSAEIQQAVLAAADAAEAAGAAVTRDVELPVDTTDSHDVYLRLLRAVGVGDLDDDEFARLREIATGDAQDWRTRVAAAQTQTHAEWQRADLARSDLRRAWADFFADFDVLLCPVAPTTAWPHDDRDRFDRTIDLVTPGGPTTIGYYEQLFWAGINNVALLPAAALPGGRDTTGLPIGLQLIGPHLEDNTCLRLGIALEAELEGFVAPPMFRGEDR